MQKNVASQKIQLFAFDVSTGLGKTGDAANLTAYVSKDYGAVTVLADTSASEADATNAPGWYLFDLAQAETNADELLFTGKSSTGSVSLVGRPIATTPASFTSQVAQTGDNYARLGAPAGASVSADIAAAKVDTAAIKAKTDNLPAAPASTTNITAGTITTVTNLTNAPTAGDLTATMKTSVTTAATAATPTAAAVTGNVGGNVTGSVGSVVGAVGSVTGAVGSVTGAVGSVTGNVGGNVTGTVGSVVGAVGSVTGMTASDVGAIKVVTDKVNTALVLDGAVYQYTANALELAPTGGSAPTVGQIADEVQTRTIAAVTLVSTTTNLTNLPTIPANWLTAAGTAADFTTEVAAGLSIPSAAAIADAVHDEVVDGSTTFRQSIRLANAALGGKASGLATTAAVYRDLADSKDRITATVDADGNRSAVTRDLT